MVIRMRAAMVQVGSSCDHVTYQNDKPRWNFCLSIAAKESSGMTVDHRHGGGNHLRVQPAALRYPPLLRWPS